MNSDLFWYLAGALVLAAVVLSAIGIRGKASFPPSSGALAGVVAVFAALVIGTGAFAIAYAQDEQEHREHELAAEEGEAAAGEEADAEQQGAAPAAQESGGTSEGGQPAGAGGGGPEQVLDVTSPADGSLVFEPDGLEAAAGTITLAYDNPSPVPHNINIEVEGETIAESETVTSAATEASAELAPGQYLYYCSIPGHREAGMEGDLTVK